MAVLCWLPWLLGALSLMPSGSHGALEEPRVPATCLSHPGDINLGLLTGFLYPGGGGPGLCDTSQLYPYTYISLQYYEAFRSTLEEVNSRSDLLPNVTLGYVIHDTCWSDLAALAKAQLLVPPVRRGQELEPETCRPFPSSSSADTSQDSSNSTRPSSPTSPGYSTCQQGASYTRVVGVVDPPSSPEAHLVAPLLGLYEVPVLSTQATSDELSDEHRYPYFSRLVPTDGMLIEAMFDFIDNFNWTYVSVLHVASKYGENAAKVTMSLAKQRKICVPILETIPSSVTPEEAMIIARKLQANREARVVIQFLSDALRFALYDALEELGMTGYFMFIAGDLMLGSDDGPRADNTFVVFPFIAQVTNYKTYVRAITPETRGESPWVMAFWEYHFNCKWNSFNASNSCEKYRNQSITDRPIPEAAQSLYMDAVLVYAHALDQLIHNTCPEVFATGRGAEDCISGQLLNEHIRNVSFHGYNGVIEFDGRGDRLGKFSIKQYRYDSPEKFHDVGLVDKQAGVSHIHEDEISWLFSDGSGKTTSQTAKSVAHKGNIKAVPKSVCSLPCGLREYRIQLELPCCWQCIPCAINQVLNENQTGCEQCPLFTWPDELKGDECKPIDPDYLRWTDIASIIFAIVGTIGLSLGLITAVWFFKHRKSKLIKACSLQMTSTVLTGICFSYATTFAYLAKPTNATCIISKLSFDMSNTLIYVPLLTKTIRIYRVFKAGQAGLTKPRFTSNRTLIAATTVLISVQICLSAFTELFMTSSAQLRMRIPILKEVEMFCFLQLGGFIPPVAFNLLLILMCAIFGFLVRKLPQNFNESWHLYVCVSSTLFLWIVFLPTYFTTYYAIHQVVLLVSCLLINAAVVHICIFAPKIYAVYYADAGSLNIVPQPTKTSAVNPVAGPSVIQVDPAPPFATLSAEGKLTPREQLGALDP